MNTYYIIDEDNKLIDEFDCSSEDMKGRFESWLNDNGGLKEFLLVQRYFSGKLQVTTMLITT